MASIGNDLDSQWTIFRLGEKMPFTNLSMIDVRSMTSTTQLLSTLKTILTVMLHILISNSIVSKLLSFRLVAYSKADRLLTGLAFSHYALRNIFRMWLDPAPVSKTLFTGCILLALRPIQVETS